MALGNRSCQFVTRPRQVTKGPDLHAAAAVPIYWIINLVDHHVEGYTDPTGPDAWPVYRVRQDYHLADSVPFIIDGRDVGSISVHELLP